MGNCVACVNKNDKQKRDFDGLAENSKPIARVTDVKDLNINKENFILTNDGKFGDKYSMGNLLGQGAFGEVRKC